jgi:DNA-directed RNA polymerase specialized sigma24 family protein
VSLAELVADPAPGPGELIEQRERVAAVRAALARLSPEQRR